MKQEEPIDIVNVEPISKPTKVKRKTSDEPKPRKHRIKKKIVCEICGFKTAYIQEHMSNKHLGLRPFPCEYCDKRFKLHAGLKRHTRIHLGIKPHKCKFENCDRTFTEYASLSAHMTAHSEERNFECPLCKKKFKHKNTVRNHLTFHHSKKRTKTCEVCFKSFATTKDLKQHSGIHTGEKPHGCRFCERHFLIIYNRNSHEKRRHPVECANVDALKTVVLKIGSEPEVLDAENQVEVEFLDEEFLVETNSSDNIDMKEFF